MAAWRWGGDNRARKGQKGETSGQEEAPEMTVMFTALMGWFHRYLPVSECVRLYVLNMCSFLKYVIYFSIKLLLKKRGLLEFIYPNVEITLRARLQTVH